MSNTCTCFDCEAFRKHGRTFSSEEWRDMFLKGAIGWLQSALKLLEKQQREGALNPLCLTPLLRAMSLVKAEDQVKPLGQRLFCAWADSLSQDPVSLQFQLWVDARCISVGNTQPMSVDYIISELDTIVVNASSGNIEHTDLRNLSTCVSLAAQNNLLHVLSLEETQAWSRWQLDTWGTIWY